MKMFSLCMKRHSLDNKINLVIPNKLLLNFYLQREVSLWIPEV